MRAPPCLIISFFAVGAAHGAQAAAFDFRFVSSGQTVGQGSFSFPDADLPEPFVDASQFTSFTLSGGGETFRFTDLIGAYEQSTDSFAFSQFGADGFGLFLETRGDYLTEPSLLLTGGYLEPCYVEGLCGPQYPPVFEGYQVSAAMPGEAPSYSARFETLVITPAGVQVPEPATAALLGASLAGLGALGMRRSRRETPEVAR